VALADYCPYIQEFTWRSNNVVVRGSHCMYEENQPSDERNFALESYGPGARCFDHTERMWEERSCSQVRQWQHWGSGCYNFTCQEQRLHMQVLNHTFTCFYPGQEIEVRLVEDDWLHSGSLICPPCNELCGEQFAAEGSQCKGGIMPPLAHYYPEHRLTCGAAHLLPLALLLQLPLLQLLRALS